MVFYTGTDALKKGEGVCYDSDRGTATDADAKRCNYVERPTVANSGEAGGFAGVAVENYSADSGGQFIEIWEPGSKCVPVALAVDTVIGTGLLTFVCTGRYNVGVSAGNSGGRFYNGKFRGRGSAIPRETVTAALELETDGATWSLATDGVTLTVADSSDMSANDTVLFFGGEDDGTGTVIPGKYLISSITDATTIVLASSAVDVTPAAALTCIGVIYTGNPLAICDLLDGEVESNGIEFLNPPNAGTGAMPFKTLGLTYIQGGITLAADVDVDLAQGVLPGDQTAWILLGTLTTNDFTLDLATNGLQFDGATALAEVVAFDAAADAAYLRFNGSRWHTRDLVGGAAEG
jgi:hypothetical protein